MPAQAMAPHRHSHKQVTANFLGLIKLASMMLRLRYSKRHYRLALQRRFDPREVAGAGTQLGPTCDVIEQAGGGGLHVKG